MKRLPCIFAPALIVAGLAALQPAFAMMPVSSPASAVQMDSGRQEALPSPPAVASVSLSGKDVTIHYNTPFIRGRKIMGGLVPYGEVWRTGANPATSLKTTGDLKVGGALVSAGSYTLYTLPSEGTWMLIINKQTGQWGTIYDRSKDLVRVEMKKETLPEPQDKMSISFEKTQGGTTELHVRWETTDVFVPVVAQ